MNLVITITESLPLNTPLLDLILIDEIFTFVSLEINLVILFTKQFDQNH